MEDIMGLIMGIGLAVVIGIVIMRVQSRKRGQSWQGVVTDITRFHDMQNELASRDHIRIKYRKSDGRKGKLQLDEHTYGERYSDLRVGDRLVKEAGEDYPRIES